MSCLRLPARLENLEALMDFIRGCAEKKGFSREHTGRIELVAEEALVNIFRHAYKEHPGDVEVRSLASDDASLILELRDQGINFNPLDHAEPDITVNVAERKVGGMGIYLMRKMTDRLEYRREDDTNILTLGFTKTTES